MNAIVKKNKQSIINITIDSLLRYFYVYNKLLCYYLENSKVGNFSLVPPLYFSDHLSLNLAIPFEYFNYL